MAKHSEPEMPRPSGKETVVLELLLHGERYGLQLVRESDGQLKRGTVYVTLDRMETKGLVASRQEDKPEGVPGIPRRLYRLTGVGERALRAHQVALAEFHGAAEVAL